MAMPENKRTQTQADLIFILIRGSSLRAGGDRRKPKTRCEYLIKQTICENRFWPLPRVLLLFCNRSLPKKQLSHNFNIFTYKATVKPAQIQIIIAEQQNCCVCHGRDEAWSWCEWERTKRHEECVRDAMRLNLVFYGEDKTVIYGTSNFSRERERNNRFSTQWT